MLYKAKRSNEVTGLEKKNRELTRKVAAEGMVLLKNNGTLPIAEDNRKIALFGNGARKTVKGGTGSGDVNERYYVTVEEGLENAGYEITTKQWLDRFDAAWEEDRKTWKQELIQEAERREIPFVVAYLETLHLLPADVPVEESDMQDADTAVYVIGRRSGEGADRSAGKGDYELSEVEEDNILKISQRYDQLIVLLNVSAPVEITKLQENENVDAILHISQGGSEAGNAAADILTGKCTPSGKLTDTWAHCYEDYAEAMQYSYMDADSLDYHYREGIQVGYRYFGTREIQPLYEFGYGLSYAEFEMELKGCQWDEETLRLSVCVENRSNEFPGKEVVQVYCQQPEGTLEKAKKVLVGFKKSTLLNPGGTETIDIACNARDMASFDEKRKAWVAEKGTYRIFMGNSSENCREVFLFTLEEDKIVEALRTDCAYQLPEEDIRKVRSLTEEQLMEMVTGAAPEAQKEVVGNASVSVVGAAGETASGVPGIPSVVMADGGSGLRLLHHFQTDEQGNMIPQDVMAALERGAFSEDSSEKKGSADYYQYCTAFPIGSMLAQTWNEELLREVGKAVSSEMKEYGVHLWLAPSINIHRNPLCGRNFEYYSEDPLLAGILASAVCKGVQEDPNTGVTIKHFACNNQEYQRYYMNSIVSEQALREIYLRPFEIVVRTADPTAIMTSYNKINGVYAANNAYLCTEIARNNWGYEGIFMTDWGTTDPGDALPEECINCGNDLIMPGGQSDLEALRSARREGRLSREALEACAGRILHTVKKLTGH